MAAMQKEGFPPIFAIDRRKQTDFSGYCEARTYVTMNLGRSVRDYGESRMFSLQLALHVAVGIRTLREEGFVHGDKHPGNLLVQGRDIHLIDFGISSPYVDLYGNHIAERSYSKATEKGARSLQYLSVWHLESGNPAEFQPSRRDDLFRLAELLNAITSKYYRIIYASAISSAKSLPLDEQLRSWAEQKRAELCEIQTIPIIKDFYLYTLTPPVPARRSTLNPRFLSPWHLESGDIAGYKGSRRDDLFRRFACVLYELSSAEYRRALIGVGFPVARWIAFRRITGANYGTPEQFRRFMEYTVNLRFDQQPDYNQWLRAFAT